MTTTEHGKKPGSRESTPAVYIYVDGSWDRATRRGGWATIITCQGQERTLTGRAERTTNNQMELRAVIAGLQLLKKPCSVRVVTDSTYVAHVLQGGSQKSNQVLAERLLTLAMPHAIEVEVVPGHSGHVLNERVDRLARMARERSSERGDK